VVANVRLVARRPSIRLIPAMQGQLGIELARDHHPHLIFLDLHLPDITGVDVLAALRRNPATRSIPVVILTADATRRELDKLKRLGARSYETKPIGIRRLLELVDDHAPADARIPNRSIDLRLRLRSGQTQPCRNHAPEPETHGDYQEERMSTASPKPAAPRPAPAQPVRAEGPSRHAIWRALFVLLVLVLILITVWHVTDQITKRHAEESFADGQVQLQIAKIESRTHVAEARARAAAAEAARGSAIATAGIAAAHSLEGSGSKRIQEIFAAITDVISQAGTGSSWTAP